jgi:hypothetical protein
MFHAGMSSEFCRPCTTVCNENFPEAIRTFIFFTILFIYSFIIHLKTAAAAAAGKTGQKTATNMYPVENKV